MARKPSQRRNFKEASMDVNLTPMMNLIAILIPALLVSVTFVEIVTLEALAATRDGDQLEPFTESLGLTVTVTERGFQVATKKVSLDDESRDAMIPVVTKPVSCQFYTGTWPPPRTRNRTGEPCSEEEIRSFDVYDYGKLTDQLSILKDDNPSERTITIVADADVEYEVITGVMDASRVRGDGSPLFDQVLVSPTHQ